MKKWMNTLFFGCSFIATVLIEAYSIQVLKGNLYVALGLGLAVLTTGYMFMNSILVMVKNSKEASKFYIDGLLNEESEKWSERYMELLNLQKASYTATKKNSAMITEQFDKVLSDMEEIEKSNVKFQQKMMELQKKSLEGQKNALNLEINYNKENSKRIIGMLKAEIQGIDTNSQISNIIKMLETHTELLKEQMGRIDAIKIEAPRLEVKPKKTSGFYEDTFFDSKDKEKDDSQKEINSLSDKDAYADSYNDSYILTDSPSDNMEEEEEPGDNIIEDAILTNTFTNSNYETLNNTSNYSDAYTYITNEEGNEGAEAVEPIEDTTVNFDSVLSMQGLYTGVDTAVESEEEEQTAENNSFHEDWSLQEESEPEVQNVAEVIKELETPTVVPLYADPNKSLTADEIAALFASYGK